MESQQLAGLGQGPFGVEAVKVGEVWRKIVESKDRQVTGKVIAVFPAGEVTLVKGDGRDMSPHSRVYTNVGVMLARWAKVQDAA